MAMPLDACMASTEFLILLSLFFFKLGASVCLLDYPIVLSASLCLLVSSQFGEQKSILKSSSMNIAVCETCTFIAMWHINGEEMRVVPEVEYCVFIREKQYVYVH